MAANMSLRIGQGWDTHRMEAGRPLILGGVHVPFELGLAGHSDADVLFHAVTDAVLGALALGDIGMHFLIPLQSGKTPIAFSSCNTRSS
jgi:2-C-methyl-D-erythritol 2,4-cyclodiphosphate synthase